MGFASRIRPSLLTPGRLFQLLLSRARDMTVRPSGVTGKDWWPGGRQRRSKRSPAQDSPPGTTRCPPALKVLSKKCFHQKSPFAHLKTVLLSTSMPCNICFWCKIHFLPQIMGLLLKLSVNLQRASVALKAKVFNRCQNTILLLLKMQILNHNDCQSRILVGFGFS